MPKRKAPPTAWKPGQSGNEGGAKRDKFMRDALILSLKREAEKGKKTRRLQLVAESLVNKAIEGDVTAAKEIFDRVDGKVANINVNAETPLDGADTASLRALQEALEGLASERDPKPAGGDEGETVH